MNAIDRYFKSTLNAITPTSVASTPMTTIPKRPCTKVIGAVIYFQSYFNPEMYYGGVREE
jgi:hypothetical protein